MPQSRCGNSPAMTRAPEREIRRAVPRPGPPRRDEAAGPVTSNEQIRNWNVSETGPWASESGGHIAFAIELTSKPGGGSARLRR